LEKNGKEIKDLKEKLSISITEENFEESIKLRDKIKNLRK
jgi:protein-arginine kinase activator protein McsA